FFGWMGNSICQDELINDSEEHVLRRFVKRMQQLVAPQGDLCMDELLLALSFGYRLAEERDEFPIDGACDALKLCDHAIGLGVSSQWIRHSFNHAPLD